jgi:AraC family transcriptional regulator
MEDTATEAGLASGLIERLEPRLSHDPVIRHLGAVAVNEIERGDAGSALQLDALGTMLCVHLLRLASKGVALPLHRRGGLAAWQIKRSTECMRSRLNENPTLAELAAEVGVSQSHFSHAFKQSTGMSPHRYLMQCRLQKAKELLANTTMSMIEIAVSIGYSEPTQLARLFAMELDTTPTAYRRATASPARASLHTASFMPSVNRK